MRRGSSATARVSGSAGRPAPRRPPCGSALGGSWPLRSHAVARAAPWRRRVHEREVRVAAGRELRHRAAEQVRRPDAVAGAAERRPRRGRRAGRRSWAGGWGRRRSGRPRRVTARPATPGKKLTGRRAAWTRPRRRPPCARSCARRRPSARRPSRTGSGRRASCACSAAGAASEIASPPVQPSASIHRAPAR